MKNNYDPIARYYDVLSRLVFFRSQVRAQTDQLSMIAPRSKILIVGGGTGWILEEIAKIHPSGLSITYVEISEEMLVLSKKRNKQDNEVIFIHAAAEGFKTTVTYDVIITAFLFDNFSAPTIKKVFASLNGTLAPSGYWLFTDFYYAAGSGKNWKWFLLKSMYLFFSHVSNIEAKMLINTEGFFAEDFYQPVKTTDYYGGFIKAIIYQKAAQQPVSDK